MVFSWGLVGDMGCCQGLWRSVRFWASYGGEVPGLRRSLRGNGVLWWAVGWLLGSCREGIEGGIGALRELWVGCNGR